MPDQRSGGCFRLARLRAGAGVALGVYRAVALPHRAHCETFNPRANCASGNCVTAQIERAQRVLSDETLPPNVRLEALAFMVHFAGDVHMPLHSGDREDRGGNDREVVYGIAPGLNLHWAWDVRWPNARSAQRSRC
jgi:hypothetical protein